MFCILCHEALEQGVPTIIPNICAFLTPIVSATPNVSNLPPPVSHLCHTTKFSCLLTIQQSNNVQKTVLQHEKIIQQRKCCAAFEIALVSAKWFKAGSKSKWRRSRRGPPSQWEAPIPTFTGNDPCVNTFGPRGNWLFLLAMFTCQRLVGACA